MTTRREFLGCAAASAAAFAVTGCSSAPDAAPTRDTLEVPSGGYPTVEAGGSHREIGRQLGAAAGPRIREYLESSRDYPRCRAYAREHRARIEAFLDRARRRFPDVVEELRGLAEGTEIPFEDLFAYNCRSEIGILDAIDGCSTIAIRGEGRMLLAHNEDGDDRNIGRMYVAKVRPPSGVDFVAFVYPGLLAGNGPGFNRRGIVQTTNYLQPRTVPDGVPRYFVGRALLEAESLEAAVSILKEPGRAFPWHHNLASLPDGRYLSVETFPDRCDVLEPEGVYLHTNHVVHPALLAGADAPPDVPGRSSLSRWEVLGEAIAARAPRTAADAIALLSLHEGRPEAPCRHPAGPDHGATLGTAVFEAPALAMTLYHGNPCRGLATRHELRGLDRASAHSSGRSHGLVPPPPRPRSVDSPGVSR